MGSGNVFELFSLEAVFIGILAGIGISAALSGALLSSLPALTPIAFNPASIATIILIVMTIAFLAGTVPAARGPCRPGRVPALRVTQHE